MPKQIITDRTARPNGSEMIYSRFGSKLTLVSKGEDKQGQLSVQASCEGTEGVRAYRRGEMMADGGNPEIDAELAKLPLTKNDRTRD